MNRKSYTGKIGRKSRSSQPDPSMLNRQNMFRLLLLIGIFALYAIFYISLASRNNEWVNYSFPNLKEGDIPPRRELAPFDFAVPKSDRQLDIERRLAVQQVLPVFLFDTTVYDSVAVHFRELLDTMTASKTDNDSLRIALTDTITVLAPEINRSGADSLIAYVSKAGTSVINRLNRTIAESFENISELLIVPTDNYVAGYTENLFVLTSGDSVSAEMTISVSEAADLLAISFRNAAEENTPAGITRSLTKLMQSHLVPNLYYDSVISSERRRAARDSVSVNKAIFKRNERIIDANVPVTAEQLEILDVLKREVTRRSFDENRLRHYAVAGGKSLIGFGIIGVIVVFLMLFRKNMFRSMSRLMLISIIVLMPVLIGYYAALSGSISQFLIPVAIASILLAILFDAELALLVTLGVAFTVASFNPATNFRLFVIYFLAGAAGIYTVGHVRHRKEFYRSMIAIPLVTALAVAATHDWITHTSMTDAGYEMFLGALNGFFCPIIAIGLLPVLESMFKVTTDITLLELSDLNNPLLRELAVSAPGTFSSVVVVGMLAEAAAEKVGANPLLCRVGAYYHDIGKIANAEYFIENQLGSANPHDRLTPHMSALVLTSHVKEGYELGVRYGLPDAVLDIIRQHHGTSLMQSFYHKAMEEAGDREVDESNFRYPGPKPQTREAAIVMLADLSEAASRTVQEKSPGRLKTLINTIIQQRFMDGELNESSLTLKDLHNIEESFLPILVSSHHGRIEYPWQKEQAAGAVNAEKPVNGNNMPAETESI